ncbi:hypothetical protein [Streptomyces clavuligerus]|uniref:Uncharacterized protein n=1 Tax=Streptomyces clavuligerus TaxID=1901 RepID=B5GU14_STRCL|nr:hypothetical protein [Streptomyces clavuligerus]AXU16003.1 hypothetical protein D1794_26770 [Streptomyces clavuligerus]EDY49810.1 hypothetical protein SSCG_02838 [Streptomyces clavuligerus]EFG05487.1 Hypothetical protein SCLAV_0411 [Streptomyces clavuligerus]MBY6306137.1 hypothetical protein [Streptomyces clavuligerus]QCS08782.1 hypothetical protein CRV15_26130 [Streptomyces clavuligerus]
MEFSASEVLSELKNLRKGFGMEDPQALSRVGSALRYIAGVAAEDDPARQRERIKSCLLERTCALPLDLSSYSRVALALDGSCTERFEHRLRRIAMELDRDTRTARRRVDEAFKRLAEEALAAVVPPRLRHPGTPWHLRSLKTLVLLGSQGTEVIEERRIVSHRDGLTDIFHSSTFATMGGERHAVDSGGFDIILLQGGTSSGSAWLSATRLGLRVQLPRPLNAGHSHVLTFRTLVPEGEALAPYYVCTPRFPCERFDLTVRFGGCPPHRVWRLDDELPLEAGDTSLCRGGVEVDAAGEASAAFTDLEPNRSYGLGWTLTPF